MGWKPQAELDTVVAQCSETGKIRADLFRAGIGAHPGGIPPPGQDEAGENGFVVEEKNTPIHVQGAKTETEGFCITVGDGEASRVEGGRGRGVWEEMVNGELGIVNF